jgi:hypothetical protein
MEIGPLTGVRSVSVLNTPRAKSGLLPAFEIDASERPGDDAQSSSSQTPDRGLEDDDSALATEEDETELEAPASSRPASASISYFA